MRWPPMKPPAPQTRILFMKLGGYEERNANLHGLRVRSSASSRSISERLPEGHQIIQPAAGSGPISGHGNHRYDHHRPADWCRCKAAHARERPRRVFNLSLIHISEPTRLLSISYA